MNSITPNNNVNFTARMDVNKIVTNKAMWNKIAEAVETKTKNAPDVDVHMYEINDRMLAYIDSTAEDPYTVMLASFSKENLSKFLKMPEEKIVDTFKKLINIANTESQISQKLTKFLSDLNENINSESYDDVRIWELICDIARKNTKEAISKDPILKELNIRY